LTSLAGLLSSGCLSSLFSVPAPLFNLLAGSSAGFFVAPQFGDSGMSLLAEPRHGVSAAGADTFSAVSPLAAGWADGLPSITGVAVADASCGT
jgi:hypothetical protein